MLLADAIARLPADRTDFSPGEEVDVHILTSNLDLLEE